MNPTPTAADLAFPVQRFTDPTGAYAVDLLTPYWRERPELYPPPPIPNAPKIARWRDGTCCPVPANATPAMLASYYTAAKVAKILGGSDALDR